MKAFNNKWCWLSCFVFTMVAATPPRIAQEVFRQYDIRGIVGAELPVDQTYDLTRAIAVYLIEQDPTVKTVAVGADGRVHSEAIKEQVCKALQDSGLDVVFVGRCPSPVLYFALHTLPVDAGLMITASHNSQEYNGIKIKLHAHSIWGESIQEIKHLYNKNASTTRGTHGSYKEEPVVDQYVNWLCTHFKHLAGLPLSALVDCGNGAAGYVLPALVKQMNWQGVQLLYPEVDGTYPHHIADPSVLKDMQDLIGYVTTQDFALGVGLDGDCDRMAAVTKAGDLIVGDKLLSVFAQDIIKHNSDMTVIFDIKCSSGLAERVSALGGTWHRCPTGNAWVSSYMHKHNALLGGELSCHLFFADRYFGYDDGIYAMMRLFELLAADGASLEQLLAPFPHKVSSPEIRFNCPEQDKATIMAHLTDYFADMPKGSVLTIDGVHVTFAHGWGIVRPSNTGPILSARFEADTQEHLDSIKKLFIKVLMPFYDKDFLEETFG